MADDDLTIRVGADGTEAVIGLEEVTQAAKRAERALDDINDVHFETAEARVKRMAAVENERAMSAKWAATSKRIDDRRAAVAAAEAEKQLQKTGGSTKKVATEMENLTKHGNKSNGMLERMAHRLESTHKRNLNLTKSLHGVFGIIVKLGAAGLLGAGLRLVVGFLGAIGSSAVIAVAGLAPLVGLLGAIPGLGLALLSMKGIFKLAFGGIPEAVKVLTDLKSTSAEIDLVMNQMSPSARSFARALAAWKPQMQDLKSVAQQGLFPGLIAALDTLKPLIPIIRTAVFLLAQALGGLAKEGATMLASGPFRKDFATLAERNVKLIQTLGHALFAIIDVVRNIAVAAGPMLQFLADLVLQFARYLSRVTESARQSGKLEAFFTRAGKLLAAIIPVIRDFGVGLFNIFRAAGPAAAIMGDKISDVAKSFRAITGSVSGQAKLTNYFKGAIPSIFETVRLIRDLVGGIAKFGSGETVAPFIHQMRTELLPAIVGLINALSGGGGSGTANTTTLLGALVSVINTLTTIAKSGAFGSFVLAVATGVAIVTTLVNLIDKLPAPLYKAIGYAAAFGSIMGAISFVGQVTGLNSVLAFLIRVGDAAHTEYKRQKDLAEATLATAGAVDVQTEAVVANSVAWYADPMTWIIAAVIALVVILVGGFYLLYTRTKAFHSAVNGVGRFMLDVFKALWQIIQDVARVFTVTFAVIIGTFVLLSDAINYVSNVAFGALSAAAGAAASWISEKFAPIGTFFSTIWNVMVVGARIAFDELAKLMAPLLDRLRGPWQAFADFVSALWNTVGAAFNLVLDNIKGAVNAVIGALNKAIAAYNRLPFSPHVDEIGTLATGGPVQAGATALVGERGPEVFINNVGTAQVIGATGPEIRGFTQSGFVVPNDVLTRATAITDAKLPTSVLAALSRFGYAGVDSASTAALASPGARVGVSPSPPGNRSTYDDHATVPLFVGPLIGSVTVNDAIELDELERRMRRLVEDMRRDERERGGSRV